MLGIVLLGERVTLPTLSGMVLIVAGLAVLALGTMQRTSWPVRKTEKRPA
jgi:drug/metabolite transporter (DMT)-like permease